MLVQEKGGPARSLGTWGEESVRKPGTGKTPIG